MAADNKQSTQVCRSPYCECPAGQCANGLLDLRGVPVSQDERNAMTRAAMDSLLCGTGIVQTHIPERVFRTGLLPEQQGVQRRLDEACVGMGNAPEDMAKGGVKYDADKPRMDLLDAYAIEQLAQVLAFGAKKYDAHNWRKGIAKSRLLAAALRHLFAYLRGEDKDPETGLSHAAHAMCCCMFLLGLEHRTELDDRWKETA